MYKFGQPNIMNQITCVERIADKAFIPFDPNNIDYANFKTNILFNDVLLQDSDGNNLSPQDAKALVKELP